MFVRIGESRLVNLNQVSKIHHYEDCIAFSFNQSPDAFAYFDSYDTAQTAYETLLEILNCENKIIAKL